MSDEARQAFRKNVKKLRKHLKMSQPKFARHLDFDPQTIRRWEYGHSYNKAADIMIKNMMIAEGLIDEVTK